MFHDTDEARINMPPRSTNHLDFVEMVWENNTLVMQQQQYDEKIRRGCLSGFSDFFDNIFESENVNPRAVPDETTHNYDLISKKRSSGELERDGKKKLKATVVVDQFIIQGDSLVPDDDTPPIAASIDKMIQEESNDHLVPRPDISIAASNDIIAPCCTTTQHSHSSYSSSSYLETQQWSDDEESARIRSRCNYYYNRRNRSSRTAEKKLRRDHRINKKMRALQVLLPNTTNKVVDKASVLDEAIEYVKSLQLQLQLMSSGTHMFPASPLMMMPQFPMNQFAAAAAMGLGMAPHGFPHMSSFPYIPFFGGPSSVPVVQAETTSVDQIGSTPPPMSASTYPNDFSQMGFHSEMRDK